MKGTHAISGLSAGRLLKNEGCDVTVLEARNRVGGRTLTVRNAQCGYSDLGGAYVGPGQRRIQRLAKELGLQFYKVNTDGKTALRIDRFNADFRGLQPPITNPFEAMDVNDLARRLNAMAQTIPADAPWTAANAKQWDAMTVKEFVDTTCWCRLSVRTCQLVVRAVFCCELHELSLLSFLWYIKSGECLQRLTQIQNGAQERKFVGGSQQLSEHLSAALDVRLNEAVIKVEQLDDANVKVTTSAGSTYTCDYVISAMPLTLLNRVEFRPTLDSRRLQLIQRVPMGSIIKTTTYYKQAFWKEQDFKGEMATDKGIVAYCIDDTKPDGTFPAIMGFILADEARAWYDVTAEERKRRVARHYAEKFSIPELAAPVHYEEQNWMSEEYSGGCYTSTYPPGVMTSFGDTVRKPHGRVYFAGTETATSWAGLWFSKI